MDQNLSLVGMMNWTHDCPPGSRNIFIKQLDELPNKAKLLEIGTYVGVSIIEMLKHLPKAKAVVVDNWSIEKSELDYGDANLKEVFYDNIIKSEVIDRIKVLDGKSSEMLANLIEEHNKFNFIYVDASHKSLDVYGDLIMSWKLLEVDGILAIDDYLWKIDENPFNNPKTGIDHFLKLYYDEYYIIHKDYRVFLKKIHKSNIINYSGVLIKENVTNLKREKAFQKKYPYFRLCNDAPNRFPYCSSYIYPKVVYDSVIKELNTDYDEIKKYDNLINIIFMVKNSSDSFREILRKNKPYMDRWTILDTGSTDNTIQIIEEELSDIPGELYQEPFINFRDSRNKLLEICYNSENQCEFNVMLDDTYVINGDLRKYLELFRGDDTFDSFSILIKDNENIYQSNRITKNSRALKYENLVHEILQEHNNVNGLIPEVYIEDITNDYMMKRTEERKQYDLNLLKKMKKEDKQNPLRINSIPRTLYYIGTTYIQLKDWELAYKYFKKRGFKQGYISEKSDALYYKAAIATFYLNKPWDKCFQLWKDCFNNDNKRTEALYFIADHYYNENNREKAWEFIHQAYKLGVPLPTISFRKDIHYYHIPRLVTLLAFEFKEYFIGYECCKRALAYRYDDVLINYLPLYELFCKPIDKKDILLSLDETKKTVIFIAPYGWEKWNGKTYYTKGLGGSESWVVNYAEYIQMEYNVIVFCNTDMSYYNEVYYVPLDDLPNYLLKYKTDYCFVSRAPEYTFMASLANIPTVYLVLHDVVLPNMLISNNTTKVFLLSDWHKEQFLSYFPTFTNRVDIIKYGIELDKYQKINKKPFTFIYSSFANRGLLLVLQTFPMIKDLIPEARLDIFCDLENKWLNTHYADMVVEIKKLLVEQKDYVTNHGFVSKNDLTAYWKQAHVWLYPNTWVETFCMTALEAQASRTVIITNHMGALRDTVGNRGYILSNNPTSDEIFVMAIDALLKDSKEQRRLVDLGYEYAQSREIGLVVREFIENYLK